MKTAKKKTAKKPAAKKPALVQDCKCLEQCNKQLIEERGAALNTEFVINFAVGKVSTIGPILSVHWHKGKPPNRRAKLPTVFCTYCPFCGKKKPQ